MTISKKRITAAVLLTITVLQALSVFWGPFTFVRKPSLVLSPIYAPGFTEDEILRMRNFLERELAAGSAQAVYPRSLIENFYLEKDNRIGVFDGAYRGKDEAYELAEHLGVERVATASALVYSDRLSFTLTIYDIATDQVVGRSSFNVLNLEELSSRRGLEGEELNILGDMGIKTPGLGAGGSLYLLWILCLFVFALFVLVGASPIHLIVEILLSGGILLSLFSWIYALNGDMDYVQRFVATSGVLNISDTSTERRLVFLRFLLPMLLLLIFWLTQIVREAGSRTVKMGLAARAVLDAGAILPAALSALLFTLSLPNFLVLEGLPFLSWIATVPLYLALIQIKNGRKLYIILFFIGFQSLMVNWWQGTFSYVSLPFTVALSLVQSLPFVVLLTLTLSRSRHWWLTSALLFVAFDWFRSVGFLGYPWGILGISQYGNPAMIQLASLTGVWGVSFLPHLTASSLAWGFHLTFLSAPRTPYSPSGTEARNRESSLSAPRLRAWIPFGASLLLVVAVFAGGALTLSIRDRRAAGEPPGQELNILLVQQNTDPRKHDYQLSFDELSRLTEEGISQNGPFDLVAWPESGFVPDIRFWLKEENTNRPRGKLVSRFLDWQRENGISLLTGTQDHRYQRPTTNDESVEDNELKDEKLIMNSAMYLAPDRKSNSQRDYYYKIRLVPFTENFPYHEQFPWIAELLHNFSTTQWTPGNEYKVFDTGKFRFSTPICFEDVFPNHVRQFVLAGAQILVNISNDYWANTPLEGYQHASHAVFRTVENRRPLVRATSSGWTISVDSSGRISPDFPEFYTPGFLSTKVSLNQERKRSTLYTRWGDWFPVSCAVLWLFFVFFDFFSYRRRSARGHSEEPLKIRKIRA